MHQVSLNRDVRRSLNSDRYDPSMIVKTGKHTGQENHLLPFMTNFRATHFLQDGAPCHKTKVVTALLKDCPFEVIDWPGNSPDLNPIENCWNLMKDKLKEKNTISVPLLTEEIKKLWCIDMSNEYLCNLSDSMPRRIKIVIKNKGEMSKY